MGRLTTAPRKKASFILHNSYSKDLSKEFDLISRAGERMEEKGWPRVGGRGGGVELPESNSPKHIQFSFRPYLLPSETLNGKFVHISL